MYINKRIRDIMEVINNKIIANITKYKKISLIKIILTFILIIISTILLIVFINREYKGLFVFSGFLVLSILINYLLYQLIYVYLYLRNKYKYYQKILSSQRRKEVKAKIIDDLNIETFEKIKFNSYLVIDEEDNKFRILCDIDSNLEINKEYKLLLYSQVVISYECE